jgi:hypothetical protein
MSKIRALARGRLQQISYEEEFMARHVNEQSAADFLFLRGDFGGSSTTLGQILTGRLRRTCDQNT